MEDSLLLEAEEVRPVAQELKLSDEGAWRSRCAVLVRCPADFIRVTFTIIANHARASSRSPPRAEPWRSKPSTSAWPPSPRRHSRHRHSLVARRPQAAARRALARVREFQAVDFRLLGQTRAAQEMAILAAAEGSN